MGRRPRALKPDASARDRFGAELRRWRMERGLTQRDLAGLVWHSQELVAKVEKGERWPSWYLANRCDLALATGGVLATLWPAVERQRLASDRRRRRISSSRPGNGRNDGSAPASAGCGSKAGGDGDWRAIVTV